MTNIKIKGSPLGMCFKSCGIETACCLQASSDLFWQKKEKKRKTVRRRMTQRIVSMQLKETARSLRGDHHQINPSRVVSSCSDVYLNIVLGGILGFWASAGFFMIVGFEGFGDMETGWVDEKVSPFPSET